MPDGAKKRPRHVVLTGGIATGKSYVLAQFDAMGVPTLDADRLAHQTYAPGGPAWLAIRDRFGMDLFDDENWVDRRRLATLVFGDREALAALNSVVPPHVHTAVTQWLTDLNRKSSKPFTVVAIPLYYEGTQAKTFDSVIVTACHADRQLRRVQDRGLDKQEAMRRIEAQLPTADKVARGDYVIWTDGALTDTEHRVKEVYRELSEISPLDCTSRRNRDHDALKAGS